MATFNDALQDDNLLLKLFQDHVKKQLKDKMLPIAMQELDAAVDQAVKSLEGNIQDMYNRMNNERLIKIVLEKK